MTDNIRLMDKIYAQFIVKACNCHEALVEALKTLLEDYEGIVFSEFATITNSEPYKAREAWHVAKQALAKVEEV